MVHFPMSHFPAVQEMLERQFAEAENLNQENIIYINSYTGERKEEYQELTEEDKELIRYMIENARWDNSMQVRDIQGIIMEEVPYYFKGDKTAREVALTIQNRIALFLNE